jgi:hypothetical protein
MRKLKDIKYNSETGEFFINDIKINNSKDDNGYIRIMVNSKRYKASRLAWLLFYGKEPQNLIDHINGIRSDNRICNLRDVTNSENCQNQLKAKRTSTSGFLGVKKRNRYDKWWATISKNGIEYYLGDYNTPEEAHNAYLIAKKELHIPTLITS